MSEEIKSITFGIMGDRDVDDLAVCVIDKPLLTEDAGCLYDKRMGSVDGDPCKTCNKDVWTCPGHFGKILLNVPIVLYPKMAAQYLRCFCLECSRLLCSEGELALNGIKTLEKTLAYVAKQGKMGMCHYCNAVHPEIKYSQTDGIITAELKHKTTKSTREITPEEIKRVFDSVPDADVRLMGLDPAITRPSNFALTVFPVIPSSCRPKMQTPESVSDDDLSLALVDLIKYNNALAVLEPGKEKYVKTVAALRMRASTYCDNTKGKAVHTTNHRPYSGLKERIDKKDGLFRKHLMGKRCEHTARSVIGPDPTLEHAQVGIPVKIADTLTIPEKVTPFNIDQMTRLVNSGRAVTVTSRGVKRDAVKALIEKGTRLKHGDVIKRRDVLIEVKNCNMKLLSGDEIKTGESWTPVALPVKKTINLTVGDVVERHLKDGDIVMINRQPTLHKNSCCAMRVVVKPGQTIRINLATTSGFNADFDGDEMNVIVPQTIEARAELTQLSLSSEMMLSSQTNKPVAVIVQDTLLGAYLMTARPRPVDVGEFMDVLTKTSFANRYDFWSRVADTARVKTSHARARDQTLAKNKLDTTTFFSFMFPNDFFYQSETLTIVEGVIVDGYLSKATLGGTKMSLIRVLCLEYGAETTATFIDDLQFTVVAWLETNGFSIGVDDCFINAASKANIDKMINKSFLEANRASRTTNVASVREARTHCSLNKISDAGKRFAIDALSPTNNVLTTVQAGSKGTFYNIAQIVGVVGQQNVSGGRPRPTLDDETRTTPHYPKIIADVGRLYESRGFVASSFFDGLNPQEAFFHAMSGREGMINTAMGTSDSGYNQRKSIKILEDLQTRYDGTVRGATGNIYQYSYGHYGFDPAKTTNGPLGPVPCDPVRLATRINYSSTETPEHLSAETIDSCLSRAILSTPIPAIINDAIVAKKKSVLRQLLANVRVSPDKTTDFCNRLVDAYNSAVVPPGEAVGIQAAQSIGEKQTQLTLNTFHTAGKLQEIGVDRFQELLDVRKTPKRVSCTIKTKRSFTDAEELRSALGSSLVYTELRDVANVTVEADAPTGPRATLTLTVEINLVESFKRRVSPSLMADAIEAALDDAEVEIRARSLMVTVPVTDDVDKVVTNLLKTKISGMQGIKAVYLEYDNDEWYVVTDGANFAGLLAHPLVDARRLECSDVWQTFKFLGLVAAKKMLYREFNKNITNVNYQHLQLLVDKMTWRGKPTSINRYSMTNNDVGFISKSTFEESVKTCINAAFKGETDKISGVSTAIVCGNRAKIGTNSFVGIKIDHRRLAGLPRTPDHYRRVAAADGNGRVVDWDTDQDETFDDGDFDGDFDGDLDDEEIKDVSVDEIDVDEIDVDEINDEITEVYSDDEEYAPDEDW